MNRVRKAVAVLFIAGLALCWGFAESRAADTAGKAWLRDWQQKNPTWRALHLIGPQPGKVDVTKELVTKVLEPMHFNMLILEVNYGFQFKSHPELGGRGWTKDQVRELVDFCRQHGIRVIPLLNCLGHQSWGNGPAALLDKYPQFEEPPVNYTGAKKLYCREWCPSQPGVYAVIDDLFDELLDAFDADALHVGMDEVFMIGNDNCPRCRGKDVGELYASAVNRLHRHLVDEKHVEMLMWGDRLLDATTMNYGAWEASKTGSHTAIDKIPKDIIVCDWHYTLRKDYPSVQFFQQHGFRVLPATFQTPDAAVSLIRCSRKDATDKMLGTLFTGWSGGGNGEGILAGFQTPAAEPPPAKDATAKKRDTGRQIAETIKAGVKELDAGTGGTSETK